jgi:DNA-binding MarR family transcriptional regulator
MDRMLKEQLGEAVLRFRKTGMPFHCGKNIHMGEMMVMRKIAMHDAFPGRNTSASDLHSNLYMTKPAISQILNSLENKGYVSREIDRSDRRKIAVSLTDKGRVMLEQAKGHTEQMLDTVISRLGEEDTRQLIRLLDQMADISEEVRREEAEAAEAEGEDNT